MTLWGAHRYYKTPQPLCYNELEWGLLSLADSNIKIHLK